MLTLSSLANGQFVALTLLNAIDWLLAYSLRPIIYSAQHRALGAPW
jgi:hypothetical protein